MVLQCILSAFLVLVQCLISASSVILQYFVSASLVYFFSEESNFGRLEFLRVKIIKGSKFLRVPFLGGYNVWGNTWPKKMAKKESAQKKLQQISKQIFEYISKLI